MEEKYAMIGILMILLLSSLTFFVWQAGSTGAAVQPYLECCCNILAGGNIMGEDRVVVRSQIQTHAYSCISACTRYAGKDKKVFAQDGLCSENP